MQAKERTSRREFIRSTGLVIGNICFLSGLGFNINGCSRYDFDLIIENGLVFDGRGEPPIEADVGVSGELIVEIGNLKNRSARERLNASGMAVAPGFIDIHTHTETELLIDPKAQSKIRQGVTTEMAGQCGSSVAPLTAEMKESRHERMMKKYGMPVDWQDFDGFYRRLSSSGIALNWMTMAGQGNLREYVIGMEDRPATSKEMGEMQQLARDCINEGVWGISTGLEYTPGSFANVEELTQICKAMRKKKKVLGIYATHMRNEDDNLDEAIEEALTIAKNSGVGVQISHLKSIGKRNWHKVPGVLKMIEKAKNEDVRITADRYPYAAYSTGLSSLFPLWCRDGGTEKFLENLKNPDMIPEIRKEVQFKIERLGSWERVLISGVNEEKNRWMQEKRLSEIAGDLNQDPFEVARNLLIAEKSRVSMCGFGMSEENTKTILKHPLVAIGSDGSSLSVSGPLSEGHPHPRNFGTFPRVLGKYTREEKLFPLEEAIRKMTYLPATILGIPKRGHLMPGFFADIVIFDPGKVAEGATWENPKQYPLGLPFVMVNGEFVIFDGQHTGKLPGKILTKNFNYVSQLKKM